MSSIETREEAREFFSELEQQQVKTKIMRCSGRWTIQATAAPVNGQLAVRELYSYDSTPIDEEPTLENDEYVGHAMRAWDLMEDDPVATYVCFSGYQIEYDRFIQELKEAYGNALEVSSASIENLLNEGPLSNDQAEEVGLGMEESLAGLIDVQNIELRYIRE